MHTFSKSIVPLWLCFYLTACSGGDQVAETAEQPAMPPPEVEVVTLMPRPVMLELEYPGRATGSQEVEIRARVDGILLRRHYQEGAIVEAGSPLFEIDPQPYQVEFNRANARLQQAEAQLRSVQRDWDRADAIFAKGAISASDHDRIRSELELAEAGVALAKAETEAAKINLGYTKVTAPIGGITSREAVSEGSLVGTTQGQSLLTRIVRTDPLYVLFSIPENEFVGLRQMRPDAGAQKELSAELLLPDGAVVSMPMPGTVDFTASTVDAPTGTVQARAVFANADNSVLPGQFVRVRLTGVSLDNALLVPQAAVLQGPQGTFVYTVDSSSMVQYTPITTGLAVGNEWLVTMGVEPGMRVVSNGLLKVQPGQPVTIAAAAAASASSAVQ
jgi:membrane fusion protein (multidrug efflux system)